MKTLKYIFLSCAVFAFSSCEDFLVEKPMTSVDKEGVYNSVSSAKAVLAGCYATMSDYNYFGFNYLHVVSSSSGMGVSIKATDVNLSTMNVLPSDVNVTNAYNGMYRTVLVANDIIQGMANSTITNANEKNRIWGEAYLMRSISYFNLVRLFGKLSLVTEPVTSLSEAQKPRSEVADVYKLIISDLENAFEKLPEPANQIKGYPHKYAAKAILAKVYLTLAGNDENSEYWQKAYDAAKAVYDNGQYQLVRPYAKLFGSPNKNNSESIFEIQFSAVVNNGRLTETTFPVGHELMGNIVTEGNSWGKTLPTQMAYGQFDDADPRRDVSFVHTNYVNRFSKETIMLFPTAKKDGTKNKWKYKQGNSEYSAWKKYYDPNMTASATNANFVYYRYADLLLVLAEAANELGLSDEAAKYLNEVLDRARDANGNKNIEAATEIYPLPVSDEEKADKAKFRERVFRERLKELTGECDEWYTVRRRGTVSLMKIMEGHNTYVQAWYDKQKIADLPKFVYKFDNVNEDNAKKNLLLPFPSDEINTNESIGQEDQNYGY